MTERMYSESGLIRFAVRPTLVEICVRCAASNVKAVQRLQEMLRANRSYASDTRRRNSDCGQHIVPDGAVRVGFGVRKTGHGEIVYDLELLQLRRGELRAGSPGFKGPRPIHQELTSGWRPIWAVFGGPKSGRFRGFSPKLRPATPDSGVKWDVT